jgi:outer membrane immunogenic protein
MKKLVSATAVLVAFAAIGSAGAADLPLKAPPPPAPPPFTWTGFYIGVNGGFAAGQGGFTDNLFGLNWGNVRNNGSLLAGGEAGFNYQIGNVVLGVEGDYDWAGAINANNNNNVVVGPGGNSFLVTSNNRWVSTVAARLGWAFDGWMAYGKAGGGWVGNNGFTIVNTTTGASFVGSNSNSEGAWLVGAGAEMRVANNWTLKVEYDYLGLNSRTLVVPVTSPVLPGDTFNSGNRNVQMVKVGLNYLFNWGSPVVARY